MGVNFNRLLFKVSKYYYIRSWDWRGIKFICRSSHPPPQLKGTSGRLLAFFGEIEVEYSKMHSALQLSFIMIFHILEQFCCPMKWRLLAPADNSYYTFERDRVVNSSTNFSLSALRPLYGCHCKLAVFEAKSLARLCCYPKRYHQTWLWFIYLIHKENAGSRDTKIKVLPLGLNGLP